MLRSASEFIFEDEFVRIKADKEINLCEVVFLKNTTSGTLKAICHIILEFHKKYSITNNLSDLKNLESMDDNIQDWMMEVWLPKLFKAGVNRFALVIEKKDGGIYNTIKKMFNEGKFHHPNIDAEIFLYSKEAVEYLKE